MVLCKCDVSTLHFGLWWCFNSVCTSNIDEPSNMKLELISLIVLAAASPILAATGSRRPFGVVPRSHHRQSKTSTTSCHHDDILAIRGGAVHESQTLSDLESRIQSAALQNKLTVIDFTATW